MKFLLSIVLFIQIAYAENISLSCSKNKTFVLLINGINNSEEDLKNSTNKVRNLVSESLSRYDAGGQLVVGYSYNTSEGFLADTIQLIDQKYSGEKNGINFDWALYFFAPRLFIKKKVMIYTKKSK